MNRKKIHFRVGRLVCCFLWLITVSPVRSPARLNQNYPIEQMNRLSTMIIARACSLSGIFFVRSFVSGSSRLSPFGRERDVALIEGYP